MIPQVTTGRGAGFRLFGFPVTVDPFFFVLVLFIGARLSLPQLLMLAGIVFVSVLWHELGHAFAAKRLGAEPTITLHGMGGLTFWRPPRNPTRSQMISVAVAGPFAGMLLGIAVWGASGMFAVESGSDVEFLVRAMLWVNLGWGMLNLVPMLPLDGGAIMAELLPGDRDERHRRAALVSIVIGAIAAVILVQQGLWPTALLVGWLVASNITAFRQSGQEDANHQNLVRASAAIDRLGTGDASAAEEVRASVIQLPQSHAVPAKTAAVEAALFAGLATEARDLLDRLPGNADPAIYALATAVSSNGQQGLNELAELFERRPSPYRARWLTLGLAKAGRLPEVVHHLAAQPRTPETPQIVAAARDVAAWAGDTTVTAQLTGLANAG